MFVQKIRHLIRNVYDGYECDEQIWNVDLSVVPSVLVDPPLHSIRRQRSLPGRVEQFCGGPNNRDGEVSIFVVDQIRIENVCDFRCVHGVVVVLVVVVESRPGGAVCISGASRDIAKNRQLLRGASLGFSASVRMGS